VNCQRSFPWVHGVHDKFGAQGFAVISIHTPEFEWEKDRATVERAARKFGLKNPIYLDTDSAYWEALGNRYWPAFYLVDQRGEIRLGSVGEMHTGDGEAARFEEAIARLLAAG
jgi:redoxin